MRMETPRERLNWKKPWVESHRETGENPKTESRKTLRLRYRVTGMRRGQALRDGELQGDNDKEEPSRDGEL